MSGKEPQNTSVDSARTTVPAAEIAWMDADKSKSKKKDEDDTEGNEVPIDLNSSNFVPIPPHNAKTS